MKRWVVFGLLAIAVGAGCLAAFLYKWLSWIPANGREAIAWVGMILILIGSVTCLIVLYRINKRMRRALTEPTEILSGNGEVTYWVGPQYLLLPVIIGIIIAVFSAISWSAWLRGTANMANMVLSVSSVVVLPAILYFTVCLFFVRLTINSTTCTYRPLVGKQRSCLLSEVTGGAAVHDGLFMGFVLNLANGRTFKIEFMDAERRKQIATHFGLTQSQ